MNPFANVVFMPITRHPNAETIENLDLEILAIDEEIEELCREPQLESWIVARIDELGQEKALLKAKIRELL